MTVIVIGGVWLVGLLLMLALCESAADGDRQLASSGDRHRHPRHDDLS